MCLSKFQKLVTVKLLWLSLATEVATSVCGMWLPLLLLCSLFKFPEHRVIYHGLYYLSAQLLLPVTSIDPAKQSESAFADSHSCYAMTLRPPLRVAPLRSSVEDCPCHHG